MSSLLEESGSQKSFGSLRSLNSPIGQSSAKPMSLRERVVSQSTMARLTPPIKSLTPTLQDSLNWSHSNVSESSHLHIESTRLSAESSQVQIESTRLSSHQSCSQSLPMLKLSAIEENNKGLSTISFEESVFSSCSSMELSISKKSCVSEFVLCHSEGRSCNGQFGIDSCDEDHHSCHGNCDSHLKVPSRQESLLDDTPQMHRTDESVWNSYAARNLRSMRYGSYSEDSDDQENLSSKLKSESAGDGSSTSNQYGEMSSMSTKNGRNSTKKKKALQVRRRSEGNLTSCSFNYHSDEEEEDNTVKKNFDRKRKFCGIDKSPALKQIYPRNSGLTQEIQVLGLFGDEHRHKRWQNEVSGDRNRDENECSLRHQVSEESSESHANQRKVSCKELGTHRNRSKVKVLKFNCEKGVGTSSEKGLDTLGECILSPDQEQSGDQTEEESSLMMSGIDNISISDFSDSSPEGKEAKVEVLQVSKQDPVPEFPKGAPHPYLLLICH